MTDIDRQTARILHIHPTRRCNLRCRHCYSRSGPEVSEALPPRLVADVVSGAAELGYGVVSVSGGEPLLYPGLVDVLRAAKQAGASTSLATNGMLLTRRRLRELDGLVDVLAISLDGTPESHAAMRGDPGAFSRMEGRLADLRRSGFVFGFVFTLTQRNLHELQWVTDFARERGASLVHVHPLEPEGYAGDHLRGDVPDALELAYAAVESARLRSSRTFIQVDITTRGDLLAAPERFFVFDGAPPPPRRWLSPLVLEPDGTVVPLTYGLPRPYALGNVREHSLHRLVDAWQPDTFLRLAREVFDDLTGRQAPPVFNWYDAMAARSRRLAG